MKVPVDRQSRIGHQHALWNALLGKWHPGGKSLYRDGGAEAPALDDREAKCRTLMPQKPIVYRNLSLLVCCCMQGAPRSRAHAAGIKSLYRRTLFSVLMQQMREKAHFDKASNLAKE